VGKRGGGEDKKGPTREKEKSRLGNRVQRVGLSNSCVGKRGGGFRGRQSIEVNKTMGWRKGFGEI